MPLNRHIHLSGALGALVSALSASEERQTKKLRATLGETKWIKKIARVLFRTMQWKQTGKQHVDRQIKSICCNRESQHKLQCKCDLNSFVFKSTCFLKANTTKHALRTYTWGLYIQPPQRTPICKSQHIDFLPTNVDQPPGHSQASISCRHKVGGTTLLPPRSAL